MRKALAPFIRHPNQPSIPLAQIRGGLVAESLRRLGPRGLHGAALPAYEYALRLRARGHDLRVFTWSEGRTEEREVDASLPFDVHREPARRQGSAIHPRGLKAWLAAGEPRVAFVSRASKLMRAVVPVVARRAPVVLSVHELGGRHSRRGPLEEAIGGLVVS